MLSVAAESFGQAFSADLVMESIFMKIVKDFTLDLTNKKLMEYLKFIL